jgi:hypothetical protein
MSEKLISREQEAQADFVREMSQLRSQFPDFEGARPAFDALTEAVVRFGSCELRMRRVERLRTLGLAEAEASLLAESALEHNERGLAALAAVRPFVDGLTGAEPDEEALSRWRERSGEIRARWREQVSELDIGEDDTKHLNGMMEECCDVVDEDGLRGLGRHLSGLLERLDEARRSEDRGTRLASPFPWWKIVVAALVLGWTAAAVFILLSRGAQWWEFFLLALIVSIMLLFTAIGC